MAFGELFKEIGHTLEDVAGEVIQSGTETLRQAISRRVSESEFGQSVISDVRQTELSRMLPIFVLVAVGIFLVGTLLRRR